MNLTFHPFKRNQQQNSQTTNPSPRLSPLETFLAGFCAAANIDILQRPACDQDRKKYVTIGTSVLFTALLAGCSGGYAFFTAVKVIDLSVGFGILWAGMIFNIDRSMLVNMSPKPGKQPNFFEKLLQALPRLLLSVSIGVVISTPLTLKVFEKEINAQLDQDFLHSEKVQTEAKSNQVKAVKTNVSAIEEEINKLKQTKQQKQDQLDSEIGHGVGSGQPGDGPTARSIRENIQKIEQDITNKEKEKTNEENRIQPRMTQIDKQFESESKTRKDSDGILNRFEAREKIKQKNPSASLAIHAIELLLIALEIAPVLIKLMSPEGNYEELVKLSQENTLRIAKQEENNTTEIQIKEQSIEYERQATDLEKKTYIAKISKDPQNFAQLLKMLERDFLKLDLHTKLVDKLIKLIEQHSISKEALESVISAYPGLSNQDRKAYFALFEDLQTLSQEELKQTLNLLKLSINKKAS